MDIWFDFDCFSDFFVLRQMLFGFASEVFMIISSAVADRKLLTLLITVDFQLPLMYSRRPHKSRASAVAAAKAVSFKHAIVEDRTLYYSVVAASEVISLPMFSHLFSNSDPDVVEGDILSVPPLRIKEVLTCADVLIVFLLIQTLLPLRMDLSFVAPPLRLLFHYCPEELVFRGSATYVSMEGLVF